MHSPHPRPRPDGRCTTQKRLLGISGGLVLLFIAASWFFWPMIKDQIRPSSPSAYLAALKVKHFVEKQRSKPVSDGYFYFARPLGKSAWLGIYE